jgi:MFS superfamily sulfate permease-like transporter
MASGAPLMSGIISGVIGGIVVGFLSRSHISVSGPAAGLTAIILTAITDFGAFDIFLTAVFLCGLIQLALDLLGR